MITLNTIVYEGNYKDFLNPDSWFFKFKSSLITNKSITINNLNSIEDFKQKLNSIDSTVQLNFVSDYKQKVKDRFKLDIDENTTGYYYTIPYFVCIENTKTPYVFNVATDCMRDILVEDSFFTSSIEEFELDSDCCTTMVTWGLGVCEAQNNQCVGRYEEMETVKFFNKEKNSKNFYYRGCFTDQLFFGKIDTLKNIDYNTGEQYSNVLYHGPAYGGNCFERRMVAHNVKNLKYNAVYKENNYFTHDK